MRDDAIHQVRRRLRLATRAARGAEPAPLAADRQQLVVAALASAQPQEAAGQDAALEEGIELVFDEPVQLGTRARFGVGNEAGRMPLHQPTQQGLLGAVAFVEWTGAPSGARWDCRPMACTMGFRCSEPYGLRPRAATQSPCMPPAGVCPLLRGLELVPGCGFDRQLQGGEIRTADVGSGSGAPVRPIELQTYRLHRRSIRAARP